MVESSVWPRVLLHQYCHVQVLSVACNICIGDDSLSACLSRCLSVCLSVCLTLKEDRTNMPLETDGEVFLLLYSSVILKKVTSLSCGRVVVALTMTFIIA